MYNDISDMVEIELTNRVITAHIDSSDNVKNFMKDIKLNGFSLLSRHFHHMSVEDYCVNDSNLIGVNFGTKVKEKILNE